jgi:hypothetical protein
LATLAAQIVADLDAVFDAGLAVNATHTYNGNEETLKVFFDQPHDLILEGGGDISAALPQLLVETADAGNITTASTFTISGTVYYVLDKQPDLHGVTLIYLSEHQTK